MEKEKIGSKIKELRKERNLTQTDLAKSLGYSDKSVISHIEKGDADMTYEKILLLLRTYSIDANDLFETKRIDERLEEWRNSRNKNKSGTSKNHDLSRLLKEYKQQNLSEENSMKFLKQEEFQKNLDYYCDLVHDKRITLLVKLDNGSFIYVKPVDEDEIR